MSEDEAPRVSFRLERRENFNPEGDWTYVRYYSEADEGIARTYLNGANAKHPGIWRLVREVEEYIDVVFIEKDWTVTSREEIL